MCNDCACRPDSPERTGDESYQFGDEGGIDDLIESGRTFWCHDGMRRVTWLRHPDGTEIPAHAGSYEPPIHEGRPYRADGRPGLVCAGVETIRRARLARDDEGWVDEFADTPGHFAP